MTYKLRCPKGTHLSQGYMWSGIILFLMALWQFWIAMSCAWIGDNIDYRLNFSTGEPIRSLADIFYSQWAHYNIWGGRVVVQSIVQLYCSFLGKPAFALSNAAVWVAMVISITRLSDLRISLPKGVLTASLLSLLAMDTIVDPTLQINYIWPITANLWFLLALKYCYAHRPAALRIAGTSILGFLAGAMQESFSVPIGGALALLALRDLVLHKKLPLSCWLSLICYFIGAIFLCVAPGNFVRLSGREMETSVTVMNLLISQRVFWLLIAVFVWKSIRHKSFAAKFVSDNIFWLIGIVLSFIFNAIVGANAARQMMAVELFSVILLLKIFRITGFSNAFNALLFVAVAVLLTINAYASVTSTKTFREVQRLMGPPPGKDMVFYTAPWVPNVSRAARTFIYMGDDYVFSSLRRVTLLRDETPLKVYPVGFDSVLRLPVANRVWEFAPNRFMVLQDKKNPARFISSQTIGFGDVILKVREQEVVFPEDTMYHHKGSPYRIQYLNTGALPIVTHAEVKILDNE